jgi:hypothetical protein
MNETIIRGTLMRPCNEKGGEVYSKKKEKKIGQKVEKFNLLYYNRVLVESGEDLWG